MSSKGFHNRTTSRDRFRRHFDDIDWSGLPDEIEPIRGHSDPGIGWSGKPQSCVALGEIEPARQRAQEKLIWEQTGIKVRHNPLTGALETRTGSDMKTVVRAFHRSGKPMEITGCS